MLRYIKRNPLITLLFLGLLLRLSLLFIDYSFDVNNHIVWAKDLWQRGFSDFFNRQSSEVFASKYPNYPPLSLFIFYLTLPVHTLIAKVAWELNVTIPPFPSKLIFFIDSRNFLAGIFKLPAICADLGTAFLIYLISKKIIPHNKKSQLILLAFFLFNPAFFYNSAFWGQIDMIPIFFVVLSFYLLFFTRYTLFSGVSFLLALLVKPTALVFLPIYLFFLIRKAGYAKTIIIIIISNILFWFSFLPFMRNPFDLTYPYITYNYKILAAQSLPYVTNGAFNFWALVTGIGGIKDTIPFIFGIPYRIWSYMIVGLFFIFIIYHSRKSKGQLFSLFDASYLTAFAVFLFLTKMHERYFILILPFLLLASIKDKSLVKWYLLLSLIGFLNLYHSWAVPKIREFYLFTDNPIVIKSISLVLISIFFWLLYRFLTYKYDLELIKKKFINSLQILTSILKSCGVEYRIIGSANIVSHLKKVYRYMEDIDVVLDSKYKECVFSELIKSGFEIKHEKFGIVKWPYAEKPESLKLTFFLIGSFKQNYFSYRYKPFEVRIKSDYLKATEYNFDGISFIGVPLGTVVDGIEHTSYNPKRIIDQKVLKKEMVEFNGKMKGMIAIYLLGIKLPYLYELVSYLGNLYGAFAERAKEINI